MEKSFEKYEDELRTIIERCQLIIDIYKNNPQLLSPANEKYLGDIIDTFNDKSRILSKVIEGNLLKESLRK